MGAVESAHQLNENETFYAREQIARQVAKQAEAGKWLLASLLIINGGALVVLFSNEKLGPVMLEAAGMYFVGGIISALLTGV